LKLSDNPVLTVTLILLPIAPMQY